MSSSTPSAGRDDARIESLVAVVEGPLAELAIDVEAVELTPAGKRRVLRIAVDKDGGVSLDDVAVATKAVDAAIEESGAMGEQPYTLEVTSRGVDRPLTLPRHWRRNAGRLVKLTLDDETTATGRIVSNDDTQTTVEIDGTDQVFALTTIVKALVQIEMNRKDH